MAKIYLHPGQRICLHGGGAHVGASQTMVDLHIDIESFMDHGRDEGVGYVYTTDPTDGQKWTHRVWVDDENGKLWFDDERGF